MGPADEFEVTLPDSMIQCCRLVALAQHRSTQDVVVELLAIKLRRASTEDPRVLRQKVERVQGYGAMEGLDRDEYLLTEAEGRWAETARRLRATLG